MKRRDFLRRSAGAVAALAVMPLDALSKIDQPPKVWGDGVHDDTAAIQWHVDHALPIPVGEKAHYVITDTIVVGRSGKLHCIGGRWECRVGHRPLIELEDVVSGQVTFMDNWLVTG